MCKLDADFPGVINPFVSFVSFLTDSDKKGCL